ncbi:MAG TPA: AraC family transcriptional regulator [Thermoanaerobaculia bacterium]|nr:AraC family transcriptional regulator [Thermoanaerobaculia bacterium]
MSTLALGQAFGRVPHRFTAEGIALSPVIHHESRVNVEHAHEAAFVTMMLDGAYIEKAGLRRFPFERFTALFHAAGIDHQDFIGGTGVQLLIFEFRPDLIDARRLRGLRDVSGSRVAWDMLALYRSAATLDPLEFESRSMSLIAAIGSLKAPRTMAPLQRAREYLHAHYREPLTMRDLARSASVHPVYLGQLFHRELGETVADYVKRLRVRSAAEELARSDTPIAQIAFEHGFCDQSHFQRVFKRFCGVTPARFRSSSATLPPALASA